MKSDDLERAAVAAVKTMGRRGSTTAVPAAVRHAVMACAHDARRSGRSWREIARVVGFSAGALHNWRRSAAPMRGRGRSSAAHLLAPVVVTDEARLPSHQAPVLITLGGHRVEGLDIAGLAELLRRLA